MNTADDPPRPTRFEDLKALEESLDGALDQLQGMLESRHVVPRQEPSAGTHPEDDEDLPVLEQVVIPSPTLPAAGPRRQPATATPAPHPVGIPGAAPVDPEREPFLLLEEALPADLDLPFPEAVAHAMPPHSDLVKRLASEVQVIVEACVEEALAKARKDVLAKLRTHLEITLPEILAELAHRKDLQDRSEE